LVAQSTVYGLQSTVYGLRSTVYLYIFHRYDEKWEERAATVLPTHYAVLSWPDWE